ncbi:MAG: DUF853 family protein [Lachnospiraceae bacterium]|nr:DUF853 family protein [Lachnospiraceae bacterium]
MLKDGKILIGRNSDGQDIYLLPQMSNRHGLVAGATGTGKTVTLKALAESFSEIGVPVFISDVKGDISGMAAAGSLSESIKSKLSKTGLNEDNFKPQGSPVTFWDIFGEKGIPLRTTISEMGPLLLSRIMDLNDLQSNLLSIAFRIADENDLLLVDTKDLKAVLNFISENSKAFSAEYGHMSKTSLAAILRAVVALEIAGGDKFFGEPALRIQDWFQTSMDGRGMIHVLNSQSLIGNGVLYSTFLLWLLSELFETLPEVGDLEKPRMVFFFDEAHLLFNGASKVLLEKIEQVVKLIRSKGVGIFFCTQSPRDIPDGVLAQLGNKFEHALHAYTPSEQKAVKAAAASFRENPAFDTYDTLLSLGIGEAIVSLLDEGGVPGMAERASILPPKCSLGSIDDSTLDAEVKKSQLFIKYHESFDPDSAYEFLMRRGLEEAAEAEKAEREAAEAKEQAKIAKEEAKLAEKAAKEKERSEKAAAKKKAAAAKSIGNSIFGTIGREVGKSVGSGFGKFGKTLGGNAGASLGRGILNTLFKL